MDKYIGKRLDGRYELKELIGVGGMAYVYRAEDLIGERTVAVKILKEEFLTNEEFTRRFKNESRAIAIMSHPNIVKVLDVSFGDRIQYIVMEYIDGITLKEYIDQKTITWQETVHFTEQILRALQHAHDKGIIHRDIKPQNIMLLSDGTIKMTDFGIARFSRNDMRTGMGDKAIGSVHYISPEQARGARTDEKADLYSVGVMLYEMLCGRLPFEADNAVSVAIMQLQSQPKRLLEINPEIPEGLEEITLKAMQKDPDKRYQSAAEMLEDIHEFKQNPSIRFEYKYLTEENPTKFVEAITNIRSNRQVEDVVETEPEEGESRFPLIPVILAGAAALIICTLIIVGTVAFKKGWLGGKSGENLFEVPTFVGRDYQTITVEDTKDFTEVQVEYEYNNEYKAGFVVKQEPSAGKNVKKRARVLKLTLSSGAQEVELPEVKENQTESQMVSMLVAKGLLTETKPEKSDKVAEGNVIRITPAEKPVVKGTLIYVYVSSGKTAPEKVKVDNVVGSMKESAVKRLNEQGFVVRDASIKTKNSNSVAGTVLEQIPKAGTNLAQGSEVKLVLSSGYKDVVVTMPLPKVDYAVDLQVFINGVFDEEMSGSLKNISAADSNYQKIVFDEVREDQYAATVMISRAGKGDFQTYYKYLVDPVKGKATVQEFKAFGEETTTTAVEPEEKPEESKEE